MLPEKRLLAKIIVTLCSQFGAHNGGGMKWHIVSNPRMGRTLYTPMGHGGSFDTLEMADHVWTLETADDNVWTLEMADDNVWTLEMADDNVWSMEMAERLKPGNSRW